MKKSITGLALLVLLAAGAAHAAAPVPNDLFRFNLSCNFPSPGCTADARIFLNIRGDEQVQSVNPQWFGNLLSVSCATQGGIISASDATLFRQDDQDGVRWEIFNADRTVEIDLKDHPFSGHNKTVKATLEVGHGSVSGTCDVVAHDVHGLN